MRWRERFSGHGSAQVPKLKFEHTSGNLTPASRKSLPRGPLPEPLPFWPLPSFFGLGLGEPPSPVS
eukprot:9944755-Alexandrium_andersonii.AAC.1